MNPGEYPRDAAEAASQEAYNAKSQTPNPDIGKRGGYVPRGTGAKPVHNDDTGLIAHIVDKSHQLQKIDIQISDLIESRTRGDEDLENIITKAVHEKKLRCNVAYICGSRMFYCYRDDLTGRIKCISTGKVEKIDPIPF